MLISVSETIPNPIHILIEKYDSQGNIIKKEKKGNFYVPSYERFVEINKEFDCKNDNYVVINAFERKRFNKLIARLIIKPSNFDLSSF